MLINWLKRRGRKPKIETTGYKPEFYAIISAIIGDYITLEYVINQYKEWKTYETLEEFKVFFIKWVSGQIPENFV